MRRCLKSTGCTNFNKLNLNHSFCLGTIYVGLSRSLVVGGSWSSFIRYYVRYSTVLKVKRKLSYCCVAACCCTLFVLSLQIPKAGGIEEGVN